MRAAALSKSEPGSGVDVLLAPLSVTVRSWPKRAAMLAGIAIAAHVAAVRAAAMDWNYLVQKLAALVVWTLLLANVHAMMPAVRLRRLIAPGLLFAPLVVLGAYRTLEASQRSAATELDRYAGYDVSYKLIRDALAQPRSTDPGIYDFLQRVTNIARDIEIAPLDVELVPRLQAGAGARPNIIIIVIDSLRRDYLSDYDARVTFTPNLARFAADSIVFRNAFTHYGATGLSEPSIWVGGMFPHKQYITPFFPMNALQKLLEAEHYQCFISVDTILRSVVQPSAAIVELDQGVLNKDYDLCRTLGELEQKLAARDPSRPFFVYTQPQNIHISRITREGSKPIDDLPYPGFYAPYASRLRRMDRAFGEFLAFLEDRGLYDQSIVVFTADHGDSLGEDGRWGHAYTIYPEVVRIPLIVHVPQALRAAHVFDADDLAFSTDLTPSLYYLLGHPPTLDAPMYGRPLFTRTHGERTAREQPAYLLASSYGPVYGILRDHGRALYIVDAVNYKDYDYDLADPRHDRRRDVSAELRAEQVSLIRKRVGEIHELYHVPPLR
ncbi:MAG: sulfatase-like hydrolase/transferase [Planctomycetota bacterium]